MNIVKSGSKVQIYGEEVQTYKTLPVDTYLVNFNKMVGFWLSPRHELESKEEKIYGSHMAKIEKVFKSYELSDRNFGIILSGQKGIGKSLFVKLLAEQAIQKNIPVITVTEYIPGIADFLASIEQEVVVVFDEFEKTFAENDNYNPQDEMLTLFDGIDSGKKLFIITCNETNKLNSYFLNRPGRFHYHFIISLPTDDEVREYCEDKLATEYKDNIDEIVNIAKVENITYDFLRAICFELNQGYSLSETLADLNIQNQENIVFNMEVVFSDGYKGIGRMEIDFSRRVLQRCRLSSLRGETRLIGFFADDLITTPTGLTVSNLDNIVVLDDEDYWDDEAEEKEGNTAKVVQIEIVKEQLYATRFLV